MLSSEVFILSIWDITGEESVELKLLEVSDGLKGTYRIRAHRDELIAIDLELSNSLKLTTDGTLTSSPI